eukprot:CAMPEP_0181089238 /NCGR_PEP_ID=MMETSP1071-20121207/7198_1 /TAXON_ID=35127 /ORGANISM="Thalassiosira sp., Strain NH16" /LENGTH=735 /DNA_ID=CAMNT_0023171177 /DNA_START=2015 /DNA_END=4219 /DNA_ORIENTATION=+
MKFGHWLISFVVTLYCKCADAINPILALFFTIACPVLLILWRQTRTARTHHSHRSRPCADRLSIKVAAIVGVVSVGYSSFYRGNEKLESFLDRGKFINEHYDKNQYTLSSSRIVPKKGLRYNGRWTKEEHHWSNVIRFRGVNLPAKTPAIPSVLRNTKGSLDFYASKHNVSFVGRPFPLEEAPQHFQRLSHQWGFNLIRLSTSWEAVMHEGPGIIDQDYIAYLKDLVVMAGDYGLYVLIDAHQDVWSRFSGGDGAPSWTLDAAGFDTHSSALHDSGGAVLHQFWRASEYGDMPKMMWTNNYWKLVTATMFTLFFAGDTYAPGISVETAQPNGARGNVTIQNFLQLNYLKFVDAIVETVKDCPNVIGFGTMNEPSNGLVGVEDIREIHAPALHGHAMSPFDSMRMGSGESMEVPYYHSHFRLNSQHLLNPKRTIAYKSPELDIWKNVGVFEIDKITKKRVLLRPHHFALKPGEDFTNTYMEPFYESVQRTVARHNPYFVTYAEPYIDPADPYPSAPSSLFQGTSEEQLFGWAPHWYDSTTLFLGRYYRWFSFDLRWNIPVVSPTIIDWTFRKSLRLFKYQGKRERPDQMHVLVGETGVPFSGSEEDYALSLDRTLRAMESTDIDFVIWCYEVDNNNVDGDLWNGEDLSLYSKGRGRGLQSAIRPWLHQYSIGLHIVSQRFDPYDQIYDLGVKEDGMNCIDCMAVVFVFVPSYIQAPTFMVTEGTVRYDQSTQNLKW